MTTAEPHKSSGMGKDIAVYVGLLVLAGIQFFIAYQNISVQQMFERMLIVAIIEGGLAVLFFMHLESRRVSLAGMTPYPDQEWMEQQARNVTMEEWGFLRNCQYLLHDRDTKFYASFRELIESGRVKTIRLPARSPNLNGMRNGG